MIKKPTFIHDFTDQWFELDQIDATTPDIKLYPEYDDVLRRTCLLRHEIFLVSAERKSANP